MLWVFTWKMTKWRMLHSNHAYWVLFGKSRLFLLLIPCVSALGFSIKLSECGAISSIVLHDIPNSNPSYTQPNSKAFYASLHNPEVSCPPSSQSALSSISTRNQISPSILQSLQFCGSQQDHTAPHSHPEYLFQNLTLLSLRLAGQVPASGHTLTRLIFVYLHLTGLWAQTSWFLCS